MKKQHDPPQPHEDALREQAQGKLRSALNNLFQARTSLRPAMLPYMLIFSLAPIFPNIKNSLTANADRILGMDGVFTMGIAYSLGIGMIFLLVQPAILHRAAKALAVITALLFLAWILTPLSPITPWLGVFFGLAMGGCSGIALFGFTFALNNFERLLGAALTVLFCMLSQIIFSLPQLWALSGPLYLAAQVLVTLVCFMCFKPRDYLENLSKPPEKNKKALAVVLFFFFAHRAVVFFFSYLPHAISTPLVGLVGIAVFLISMYVFFAFKFNTWYLGVFFFIGILASYALRLHLRGESGLIASDTIHGFAYMGYIASYYLLGFALRQYTDYRGFRMMILIIFNSSLLLHVLPNMLNRALPEWMLMIGLAMTTVLFFIFILLSPVFSREMFQPAQKDSKAALLAYLKEKHLTAREQEIAMMLLEGRLLKDCAVTLQISYGTIKFHAANIYRKLGISGRSELPSLYENL